MCIKVRVYGGGGEGEVGRSPRLLSIVVHSAMIVDGNELGLVRRWMRAVWAGPAEAPDRLDVAAPPELPHGGCHNR